MGQSHREREGCERRRAAREEGRGEGALAVIKRRGEIIEKARERVRESSDSGALTQRCVTLKGMCWQWEVVLLSQMTSASLLKTIG